MTRYCSTFLFLFAFCYLPAQHNWTGQVVERDGTPIFAANVYPKTAPAEGTVTDFDGRFSLNLSDHYDTLIISFIGFDAQSMALDTLDVKRPLRIELQRAAQSLAMITIKGTDPIASQFSVVELNSMDIYLNPVAQGDPLKAITILPASTTTDESANPSLRGSSADRSRVILNGVPIYNPVRSSQLNNQGFFSIFNPELIEQMQVYASNPPLTSGNSSAGLIDIQTGKSLAKDQFQLSSHLTGMGLFVAKRLRRDSSFIQAYGNLQFSEAFIGLNRANIPRLKGFHTRDLGTNLRLQLNQHWTFNSLHYAIDEGYDFEAASLNFEANASAQKERYFTVNNFIYNSLQGILSINIGYNSSQSHFKQANLQVDNRIQQTFLGIDYKHLAWRNLSVQTGLSIDYRKQQTRDSIPVFFFAIDPDAPNYFQEQRLSLQQNEAYGFASWEVNKDWTLSTGIRVPLSTPAGSYLSYQGAARHQLSDRDYLLMSAGKYHSFSTPSFFIPTYRLLQAEQFALEYSYKAEKTSMQAALYAKREGGELNNNGFFSIEQLNTFGLEVSYRLDMAQHWNLSLANAFLRQRMEVEGEHFTGPKDFEYFLKGSLQYQNPSLFTVALTYLSQPGTPYTPINEGIFVEELGGYKPIFSTNLNSVRLGSYHRIDLNISRYFRFKSFALVAFASASNLLNQRNERDILYTADYNSFAFDYFQLRSFFAGLVWQWD